MELPQDIIFYILTFDNRFILRKDKLILINKININDSKYKILNNLSIIKQYPYNENYDYIQCNRGIASLGKKNEIKYYIKVIHYVDINDKNKEILHTFNKLKISLNKYNYSWINTYIQ